MIFDPSTMPWRDAYKLLIGAVLPRPIAWVSTRSADGQPNLAPFSFFNVVAADPMTLSFSVMRRGSDGSKKDTVRNIEATGEFVVNIVSEPLAAKMNASSAEVPYDVDEFLVAELTAMPSEAVEAPRVGESLVSYECTLLDMLDVGGAKPGAASLILGTVVRVHVADSVLDNGRIRLDVLQPIGRMAGNDYVRCTDLFALVRPGR